MAIIISKNGEDAQKIDETKFGLEDKLQEYVKNNPDIVPIYEISEDSRLLVIAREFSTNSGPIDALGLDQDGNIYVIETKLYKNPDKRTVLAQALDYGASLWRHSGDSTNFIAELNKSSQKYFNVSLNEKLIDFFGIDESVSLAESIAANLTKGNIKFVILMDSVDDRLKDLITYVNQNSRFDVYAVELEYYKYNEFEIVIPKLYGSEVKKQVARDDDSFRFDNQKILAWLREDSISHINIDFSKTTKSFVRFTTSELNHILPSREDRSSGWRNGNGYYYEIQTKKNRPVRAALVLNSTGVDDVQKQNQAKIIDLSDREPTSASWIWFVAISWTIESQDEDKIREKLNHILSIEIPEFEKRLLDSM